MPLTKEQLQNLPEFNYYKKEILSNGLTIHHRIIPRFSAYKLCGDDIIMFTDEDGSWHVDYHLEGGPYKRRAFW
jgi:hypothetical protein